ncbi:MAG: tRNA (guanosine(37)-N1)-methyltransferase TrmD, partial [Candidatus Komeilibacteria bacterium CG_4_9_14_0_8_um_filter_36_9]
ARAKEKKMIEIIIHDLREYAKDKRRTVDDTPYGGGAGMILKIEPIFRALNDIERKTQRVKIEKKNRII